MAARGGVKIEDSGISNPSRLNRSDTVFLHFRVVFETNLNWYFFFPDQFDRLVRPVNRLLPGIEDTIKIDKKTFDIHSDDHFVRIRSGNDLNGFFS